MGVSFKAWAEVSQSVTDADRRLISMSFNKWYSNTGNLAIDHILRKYLDVYNAYDVTLYFPTLKMEIDTDGLILVLTSLSRDPRYIEDLLVGDRRKCRVTQMPSA